jgi:porin
MIFNLTFWGLLSYFLKDYNTAMKRKSAFIMVLVLVMSFISVMVLAEEDTKGSAAVVEQPQKKPGLWHRPTLTGDWNGLRPYLVKKGLTITLAYTGEVFSTLLGGKKRGTVLLDRKDLGFTFDLEKILDFEGMTFAFHVIDTHGGSPQDYTGGLQQPSNIDAGSGWDIYEAWVQFTRDEYNLRVKLGLFDISYEIAFLETASIFSNKSFRMGPDFSQGKFNGLSIYPDTALSLLVKIEPLPHLYVEAVAQDLNKGRDYIYNNEKRISREGSGLLLAGEIGYRNRGKRKYTKIALGSWYAITDYKIWQSKGSHLAELGDIGFYLLAEGQIFNEKKDSEQGMSGFLRVGIADKKVSPFKIFVGSGFVYTGLIRGRDNDRLGVAIAHGQMEIPDFSETILEISYGFHATPWFILKPGIQYLLNPGSDSYLGNALSFALRFNIKF